MFAAIQSSMAYLESAKVDAERYRSLLSSFREFVHNPNCPLCGQTYSSAEELRRRMSTTLEENQLNCGALRRRFKVVDSVLRSLWQAKISFEAISRERHLQFALGVLGWNEIAERLSGLEDLAARVNLPMGATGNGEIDERMGVCESRIGSLSKELGEAESVDMFGRQANCLDWIRNCGLSPIRGKPPQRG